MSDEQPSVEQPTKARKAGRPPKALIESKKAGHRGKVGRPAGDSARIAEFKARLLATSGTRVIDKVLQVAMDDDHPGQMAAIKMCLDRMLPLSMFEKDAKSRGSAVTINIVNASDPSPVIDIQAEEVQADDA